MNILSFINMKMYYNENHSEGISNEKAIGFPEASNSGEILNSEGLETRKIDGFKETLEKIEKVTDKINGYLREAIVMALRIGKNNPDMLVDIDRLSKQRENKGNITSEQISDTLWNIAELFRKYGDDREKTLSVKYMASLLDLQNFRKKYDKAIPEIITNLDKQLLASIKDVVVSLDTFTKGTNSESISQSSQRPNNINTGSPFIHNY